MVAQDVAARIGALLARPRALVLHQDFEALLVHAEPGLRADLERDVEREAVGVVQAEGLLGRNALVAVLLGPRDHVLQAPHALLERAPEALLLGRQPLEDRVALAVELRIRAAHGLHDALRVARQEARVDTERPALLDRA